MDKKWYEDDFPVPERPEARAVSYGTSGGVEITDAVIEQLATKAEQSSRAISRSGAANSAAYDNMKAYQEELAMYRIKQDADKKLLQALIDKADDDSHEWFPDVADNLQYMVLAMCGEAGEVANQLKKGLRNPETYGLALKKLEEETIDTFIYLLNIWALLKTDVIEELRKKEATNEERFGKA